MSQPESPATWFRFDSPVGDLAIRLVSLVVFFAAIGALVWMGWGEATNVVAFSLFAAGVVFFLQIFSREKLFLSEDSNSVGFASGDKKLLRTLERLSGDSDRMRVVVALAGAGLGTAAGWGLIWAGVGPVLPTCCAGAVSFFAVLFAFILWDQRLAAAYVERGYQSLMAGDLPAAIGDASESIIMSLVFRYEAYMIRGMVYLRMGACVRAAEEFRAALAQRPDSHDALAGLRAAQNPESWINCSEPAEPVPV